MSRTLAISLMMLVASTGMPSLLAAAPPEPPALAAIEDPDAILAPAAPVAGKVLQDTIWIADWTFDSPSGCTTAGWTFADNRILNDGAVYWGVIGVYSGLGGISGNAAVLRKHDLCWPCPNGYGTNWDQSIVLPYAGANATLSFDMLSDSEPGFDFVTVETDSLGLSEARVVYTTNPTALPSLFRDEVFTADGDNSSGATVTALSLTDYGPGTHEVYVRFTSDGGFDCEDGHYASNIGAGLVVDDLVLTGAMPYSEDFTDGDLDAPAAFANTAVATPFGEWARVYQHITDNDKCTENSTCALLWTDPTRIALFPDMAFGPGSAVIRNWLDDVAFTPWVSLATTPSALGTTLSFRRFGGNRFTQGKIVQNWVVRGKLRIENTDTSTGGDSLDCVTPWGHWGNNSLTSFQWTTLVADATPFFPVNSREVQFRFRVTDWQYLAGDGPPWTLNPGPGPYNDRFRIGRRVIAGPLFDLGIDARYQGQDRFASAQNAIAPGQHFSPTTDRFGTCDFSMGTDLGTNGSAPNNVVTGDSITANVVDARLAGGITAVRWQGAITAGPHAGKAPAPYSVAASGFFEVTPDSSRDAVGVVVANRWCVDLDDTYFRGGDRLLYFWSARDAGGGRSSALAGIAVDPATLASVAAAETATNGLFEISSLPAIAWAPAYLARIAADAHGDLDPTPGELASSAQRNCILYYQHVTAARRSGPAQRTSFMRSLDALGYQDDYDVYDVQGYGNTNNQLASRATYQQCKGYALIVEDDGRSNLTPNIPNHNSSSGDTDKVAQATFYQNWLDNALDATGALRATLWILGESTVMEGWAYTLFTTYCGIGAGVQDQGLGLNPDVVGNANFTFLPNNCTATFAGDRFSLQGGCPVFRNYDGYTASGANAVVTHNYKVGSTTGSGAIVMNRRPGTNSNTVTQGFAWFDIRSPFCAAPPGCPSPTAEAKQLMQKILGCVLPPNCGQGPSTDLPPGDALAAPRVTALHPNVPNPFNPTTTIAFDLARGGRVRVEVHDVRGRLVRVLLDGDLDAGWRHRIAWDGLDTAGRRASSGVYFYRLVAPDFDATRKMVLMK